MSHFLALKRQNIHFNAKLASSSALKNPSLLPKLMSSAGVDEGAQYATTLPKELWDPAGFPEEGFKEALAKSQTELGKKKEEETARGQREGLEFVSAGNEGGSKEGLAGSRAGRGSAAERVMAGLSERIVSAGNLGRGQRADVGQRGERERREERSPKRRKRLRSR